MCTIDLQMMMRNKSLPDAGKDLFNVIQSKIDSEKKIVIDLAGVVSLPSMFLNVSIGRFIIEYGADILKEKVSFAKISTTQAERLREYINKVSEK
jgi:hypothetical protein